MKVSLRIDPYGLRGFRYALKKKMLSVEESSRIGLTTAAKTFYDKTQYVVPRDTNALAQSGYIAIKDSRGKLVRQVGYGTSLKNPRTKRTTRSYAMFVHEIPSKRHPDNYKWFERELRNFGTAEFLNELAYIIRHSI